jgi:hypothetical protein
MRRAPPLVIAVLPQVRVQAAAAVLAGLAFAGLAWRFQPWALIALPVPAIWAWRDAKVTPRRLRWDGERWWLTEPGHPDEFGVRLRVLFDADAALLLRASPVDARWGRGRRYLPLSRTGQGPIWGALRATLHAARQA